MFERLRRDGMLAGAEPRSVRARCHADPITFTDAIAGLRNCDLQQISGDYVVRRADDCYAYQLCCAIDDAAPGITEVVRGMDLLDSTAHQIHLRQMLRLASPGYAHIPVLTDSAGSKLSKCDAADPLHSGDHELAMRQALTHLRHPPPAHIHTLAGLLSWARHNWQPARLSPAWA